MFGLGLQHHQIDDVDDANADIGHLLAQQRNGRHRLQRRHVACTGHHDIGFTRIARPVPHARPGRAMPHGVVDPEPLPLGLLARDDDNSPASSVKGVNSPSKLPA